MDIIIMTASAIFANFAPNWMHFKFMTIFLRVSQTIQPTRLDWVGWRTTMNDWRYGEGSCRMHIFGRKNKTETQFRG